MVNCTFFLLFFSMRRAAEFCMRRWLWIEEAGRPERRELQQSRGDRTSEVTGGSAEGAELLSVV